MKKRLLSAALAFAMVLTLLPLSAIPASAAGVSADGNGTENVTYVAKGNGTTYTEGAGWYVTHVDNTTTPATTSYIKVTDGVSVAGKYYTTANFDSSVTVTDGKIASNPTGYNYSVVNGSAVKTGLKGAVIVIGGTVAIDAVNNSTLTIGVYGGNVSVTQTNTGTSTTQLTSLTVNNTYYAQAGQTLTTAGTVTGIPNTVNVLSLTNVNGPSTGFSATGQNAANGQGVAHSLTLNNATIGAVTLSGVGGGTGTNAAGNSVADTNVTHATQSIIVNGGKIGNITVTGNNSTVTLTALDPSSKPTVSLTGTNTTLNVKGGSIVGAVTIQGASSTTVKTGVTTVAARPANVTVDAGCTVGAITHITSGELCTQANTISISGNAEAITMKNATVNVPGGNTDNITLESGTVNVSGNRATVGDVELAKNATFNLTGTNCTVGALTVASTGGNPATVTFNVPADVTNKLASVGATYQKHTIKGGTWGSAVSADALDTTLKYQLAMGSEYTYYNADQLGEAVLKQANSNTNTLTVVGESGGSQKVTFQNGSTVWGVLTTAGGTTIPKLPTQMNTVATPKWSDEKNSDLSGMYNTPASGNVVLNAGGGGAMTGDVTKLTGVKLNNNNNDASIRASINGNVITLTGAVGSTDKTFDLTLETDAVQVDSNDPTKEVPVTISVSVQYDASTKSLSFVNPGTDGYALSNGVVVENTFLALKLANGTRYTLSGSGLVVRSNTIYVKGVDTGAGIPTYPTDADKLYTVNDIEVVVNAPGYTSTQVLKDQVIALINGTGAVFDWSKSPAMKQAVNAALATITDTNVASWIQAAQRKAWSDNRTDAYNANTSETAYDGGVVWLVPYLQVTVTSYQPSTTGAANGSLTATLTPMWRVEVHPDSNAAADAYKVKDAANVAKNGVYIAKAGTALTGIAGDLTQSDGTGGVDITFKSGVNGATYAHQNGTYDYAISGGKFTVTHAGTSGLGTFVLDAVEPLVAVYTGKPASGTGAGIGTPTYYSSLQAAADAAKDEEYILVDSKYAGSTTINMTGAARTIYVQANGKNVVVANASGGLVDNNASGSLYTIKLNRDNTVTTTTDIIVDTAVNGTAVASTVRAKSGEKVTVTVQPKEGYQGTVTVKTNTGANVSVTNSGNNTFTFSVPDGATRVDVTPVFTLLSALPFTDVSTTDSYYNAVLWNYQNNFIQGTTATTFRPSYALTRAQLVTILYRNAGSPTVSTTVSPYTDTNVSSVDGEMLRAIIWATNNKIVEGYGNGQFGPSNTVRKQELAKILYLYNVYRGGSTTGTVNLSTYFTDASSISSWAVPYVQWAVANGVMGAATAKQFQPQAQLTRAQTAVCVYNYGIRFVKA